MNKSSSVRLISLCLIASVALAACRQPSPAPPQPEPQLTPQITVEFNPPATAGPTPTPRPLGNPILVDRNPVAGEELPVDKPLQLLFDQPMDRASVEQALSVKGSDGSAVAGVLDWTSDNAAAFIPSATWARASSYNIQLSTDAKSTKGLALARPEQFTVNTIGNLAVAQTIPSNGAQDVAADAVITVIFNRPVVSLTTLSEQASLPQPVQFTPAIEGAGQWLNTSIYVFQPSTALDAGTTYQAKVPPGLQDTSGALLDAEYSWAFTVAAPIVKFITPAAGATNVDLRQPISVTFSQKMDRSSAEAAFVIEPPVQGTFAWSDEQPQEQQPGFEPRPADTTQSQTSTLTLPGEVMSFVPGADYQRGTTYTVTVNAGAKAAAGSGTTQDPLQTAFRVIPLPTVLSTRPADGDGRFEPTAGLNIRFSAPISVATILPNLTVEPAISLTNVYSYYDEFSNEFNLSLNWKPSSSYRVVIGGAITDKYGVPIGKDTELRFNTGPYAPFISFQTSGLIGTYNAARGTELFASYRNVTQLDLELASITPQDLFNFTGANNSYDALRNFKPAEQNVLRAWSVAGDAALNESKNVKLLLDEAGGALPTGVYLLTMSSPEMIALDKNFQPVRHILVVTNLHITQKRGDRDGLAWVTNLNTGEAVPGVEVTFRDNTFAEIAKGTTSGDANDAGQAFVTFPISYRPFNLLYSVVGEPGGTFGMAWSEMSQGINAYDFNLPGRYQAEPYFAYLFTDRPIYRPGQMVFYKGIVRADDDARYSLPADAPAVQLTVSNMQGQQVLSQTVQLTPSGAFTGQLTLDNGAATGQYYLQACIPVPNARPDESPCSYYGVPFLVSAYRAPEFEVSLSTDKADYLAGETINAALDVKYFFGGNVANAKVQWTLLANDFGFDRYTGPGSYTFGDFDGIIGFSPRGPGFNELIASGEGATDAGGKLTISVPADLSKRNGSAIFTLEASVTDVNDQSVSARANTVVHKGRFYFGVGTDAYVYNAGDEVVANVISVDWQGKPLPNQAGAVSFSKRQWFTTQEQDQYGSLFYTSVPSDTEVFSTTLTTDADGKAIATYAPQEGGEYRIAASGVDAVRGATSVYVSSSGEYVAWRVENNDRIDLKADKDAYQVGETAKVLVPSPFQGASLALLTIERGGFIERRTLTLNSNSDVLDIPITDAFAPNVYVSVLIVKGVDNQNPSAAFRLGYTSFKVDPRAFALNVTITPDKQQYAPRDTATYNIQVTDVSGNPVQAEVSLALVDKAVLSLTDPNVPPALDAFYGARPLSIRTADTLSINVDRITDKVAAAEAKGGGGGGEASADAQFTRQNFKDTAYWNDTLLTDAGGNAQVSIILPDNLTTWTMTARAFTNDSKVGEASNEVISTKLLLVRPVTPRFFVAGDTVTLGAVVNNNTTAELDAQVSIASTGLTLVGSDAIQSVKVPAGGTARVDWNVSVLDAPSAEITMTVNAGGLQDSAMPGLASPPQSPPSTGGMTRGAGIPILKYAAPETIATAGDLSEAGRKLELIAIPPRLDTGQGDLTVQVDTGIGAAAAKGVEALEAYPYESADWAASRILVNLALARATGTPIDANALSSALQRLYGEQHSDGGWGWWAGDASDAMVTAHIVLALARAQDAGVSVDTNTLARANDFLNTQLKPAEALADVSAANRQAYLLYVLGEAGKGDSGRLGALYEQRAKLGNYGQALLAMALEKVNAGDERIKTVLADLTSAATTSATGMSWTERENDWMNFNTNTRSTAIILSALAKLDAQNALAPNVVRWLMATRAGDMWQTTQETEWAITAFADWIEASGEKNSAFNWRATLNDQALLQGAANPQGDSQRVVVEMANLLRNQANALAFERGAGEGRMYYTAHLRAFLPADSAPALNRGIVIARKYESADCEPKPEQPCAAINGATVGQNVRVRLTIVAPSDLYYVRITDPLPGGAEAIDASLKTSQTQGAGGPTTPSFGKGEGWGWWWFAHTETYDDRVAAFASYLPAGTYEYTYVMRASIAGQFKVMPASADLSYFPEVFGRSAGGSFTITR
jgi:uncharacterized protein YfaS (alpha-2-macroglobulin family)